MKKIIVITLSLLLLMVYLIIKINNIKIDNISIEPFQKNEGTDQVDTLDGSNFNEKWLNEDRLLVINIWATWCKPCIAEMPLLNEIKSEYSEDNIAFISLSLDDNPKRLNDFISSGRFHFEDITTPNLIYRDAILNFLQQLPLDNERKINVVPATFLVNKGKVLASIEKKINSKDELVSLIEKYNYGKSAKTPIAK